MVIITAFQTAESNGLARIGILETRHGKVNTPAIFPVHNLGADAGWNTPVYWEDFPEINTGMFNASYLYMDKRHRLSRILELGIHEYIKFPGIAFIDSGGFIYKKYKLTVDQDSILEIQEKAGADIASSLDYPIMLTDNPKDLNITLAVGNAKQLLKKRKDRGMLAYASIHGYDPTVLKNVIRHLIKYGDFDGFAIGSLMPSFYNFELLVDLVFTARREVPRKPLHVYGLSGSVVTALLAYLGVDSVDSSVFVISAGKRDYLVPGFKRVSIYEVEKMDELPCNCQICKFHTISEIKESRKLLSLHNLWTSWSQMEQIKTAIKEGNLEEFLNKRFSSTYWGKKAFRYAKNRVKFGLRRG